MHLKKLAAATAALLMTSSYAQAEENLWIYAKGTDTRPQGSTELKLSSISRFGKGSGDYAFHDIRPEIEYGITDKLTVGAEIMIFDHNYSVDSEDLEPMVETQGGIGSRFNDTQYGGFELSFKYNILSPYKDALGLSVGGSYERREKYRLDGADIDQDSFVASLFLQKNFIDNTLIFVLNPKVEFERRKSPGVLEEEIALDVAAGVSYRIAPKWFIGLEFRHQSDYLNPQEDGEFDPELERSSFDLTDWKVGSQHQAGNYLGPTVHYAEKEWWATAGVLWQVAGHGRAEGESNTDGRNYDEHERVHVGLSIGYEF
jgi:opacity protein-like surface antigen